MKPCSTKATPRVVFKIRFFCDHVEQIDQLEEALARKPQKFQLDLIGADDLSPDIALLARSVLANRSPKTHLITNARSSLQGGAVLVWLMGDTRLIQDDAKLFFRKPHEDTTSDGEDWRGALEGAEVGLEEIDYAQALQHINHFLPVNELAGRPVGKETLRQYGLTDNEKADQFLASVFARVEKKPAPASAPQWPAQGGRGATVPKAISRRG
jgi:hypothetical protein